MRNISETTLIKVLVNLKCLGYMGKCVNGFTQQERGKILDILEQRGLIDADAHPTEKAKSIILKNLSLCQS